MISFECLVHSQRMRGHFDREQAHAFPRHNGTSGDRTFARLAWTFPLRATECLRGERTILPLAQMMEANAIRL